MNLKKYLIIATSILVLSTINNVNLSAQAFYKGQTNLSMGLAGSSSWQFINSRAFGTLSGGTQLQMEWGIHDYVGLGFTTGIQGGRMGVWGFWGGGPGFISIPAGVVANFHFYQLIADKTSKNIHADVLDIYAGANLGSGLAFYPHNRSNNKSTAPVAAAMIWGGAHAGIRWYFKPQWALNGEVGFYTGKSFINVGVTYKLK